MDGVSLTLGGARLLALPSGALLWPARRLLVVADLHLGRSERYARRAGALLPPYEVEDTLGRLEAVLAATDPAMVVCLGDSFDDAEAARLPGDLAQWLRRLTAGRRWIWIEGNHDPGPVAPLGAHLAELTLDGLAFRHIARPEARAEISAHYHPRLRIAGTARRCFLADGRRIILPAFGTYTGGLAADDPALARLMQPGARAVLTGPVARLVPMPRSRRQDA